MTWLIRKLLEKLRPHEIVGYCKKKEREREQKQGKKGRKKVTSCDAGFLKYTKWNVSRGIICVYDDNQRTYRHIVSRYLQL